MSLGVKVIWASAILALFVASLLLEERDWTLWLGVALAVMLVLVSFRDWRQARRNSDG
jgi:drug/metabolite transporter (DMT)-like permease